MKIATQAMIAKNRSRLLIVCWFIYFPYWKRLVDMSNYMTADHHTKIPRP